MNYRIAFGVMGITLLLVGMAMGLVWLCMKIFGFVEGPLWAMGIFSVLMFFFIAWVAGKE